MNRRALLTDREREVLRGNADDVENPARYRSKVRSRVKHRLDRLEEDVAVLEEFEPKIAADFHDRVCDEKESRLARLEREIANFRAELEDGQNGHNG